jgi:hypothetical protein
MTKKVALILGVSIVVLILAIKLISYLRKIEINTVDPQASSDINQSKKNGFFLKEYRANKIPDNYFDVKEAWVEYIWKNELVDNRTVKVKTGGLQLNMRLERFNGNKIEDKRYLLDWEMKNASNGFMAKSNGVYRLFLKEQELPDSFDIVINKVRNNVSAEDMGKFVVIENK